MNKTLILVVEDDRPVQNLMITTLKAHDYRYLTAMNGETAIMEASYKGDLYKFGKISQILGGTDASDCAEQVKALLTKLDMNLTLSDLGLTQEDIPWMAENCMKVSAASVANNPVVFTQEEIADIYKKAM